MTTAAAGKPAEKSTRTMHLNRRRGGFDLAMEMACLLAPPPERTAVASLARDLGITVPEVLELRQSLYRRGLLINRMAEMEVYELRHADGSRYHHESRYFVLSPSAWNRLKPAA